MTDLVTNSPACSICGKVAQTICDECSREICYGCLAESEICVECDIDGSDEDQGEGD